MKYLFILLANLLFSQNFQFSGTISKIKNGSLELMSFINPEYYENPFMKTEIKDNYFVLKNSISYPTAYFSTIKDSSDESIYTLGLIFLESGRQNIIIDSLNDYNKYEIQICENSKINEELKTKFLPNYNKLLIKEINFIKEVENNEIYTKNHTRKFYVYQQLEYIYNYVKQNNDSYIPLWLSVKFFSLYGYDDIYFKIYNHLSKEIKETKTAKILHKNLDNAKLISSNLIFPKIKIKTLNLKEQKLNIPKTKYTLIDFWYSNCAPCISEFPNLKNIYEKYKNKGFEIVSISTDQTKYILNWKNIIKKHNLNWIQYLDENSLESKKLNINSFPTTFLLDENGKILQKNIYSKELEFFLEENLN